MLRKPHLAWWPIVSKHLIDGRPEWAGRLLVIVEIPYGCDDLAPFYFHEHARLLGGNWTEGLSWRDALPALPAPQPKAKAKAKALPKAAAAPAPPKPTWASIEHQCSPWRLFGGKRVAPVKKFLLKAGKPTSNADRKVSQWKETYKRALAGTGQNFFRVPALCSGEKQAESPSTLLAMRL